MGHLLERKANPIFSPNGQRKVSKERGKKEKKQNYPLKLDFLAQ
jgi:hypothetical protein